MIYWIITNGTKFIYREPSGKYAFNTLDKAIKFKTKDDAEKILKTQISKTIRKICFVAKRRQYEDNQKSKKNKKDTVKTITKKSGTKKDRIKFVFKNNDTGNIDYWLKKIDFKNSIQKEMTKRKKVLTAILKDIEDYTCDITHYIEFNKLNCYLGYKLESYLHELNSQRRLIKNEIIVIDLIFEYLEKTDFSSLKGLKTKIKREQNQWYYPRKLLPLFQEGAGKKTDEVIKGFLDDITCVYHENTQLSS